MRNTHLMEIHTNFMKIYIKNVQMCATQMNRRFIWQEEEL